MKNRYVWAYSRGKKWKNSHHYPHNQKLEKSNCILKHFCIQVTSILLSISSYYHHHLLCIVYNYINYT